MTAKKQTGNKKLKIENLKPESENKKPEISSSNMDKIKNFQTITIIDSQIKYINWLGIKKYIISLPFPKLPKFSEIKGKFNGISLPKFSKDLKLIPPLKVQFPFVIYYYLKENFWPKYVQWWNLHFNKGGN